MYGRCQAGAHGGWLWFIMEGGYGSWRVVMETYSDSLNRQDISSYGCTKVELAKDTNYNPFYGH